jgi:hypothetical protein
MKQTCILFIKGNENQGTTRFIVASFTCHSLTFSHMKNSFKLIISCLFFLISSHFYGQSFEWEIGNIGYTFGYQKDKFGNIVTGDSRLKETGSLALGTELRCN